VDTDNIRTSADISGYGRIWIVFLKNRTETDAYGYGNVRHNFITQHRKSEFIRLRPSKILKISALNISPYTAHSMLQSQQSDL